VLSRLCVWFPEDQMQHHCPRTWAYLSRFRGPLLQRSGYRLLRPGHPFYILSNVNEATFAGWKVVWKYIATEMTAAVIGRSAEADEIIVPDHRVMIVPSEGKSEAHYIAATLNSSGARFMVRSFIIGTQISTHVLGKVRIPRYNPANPVHQRLAALSQRAHELAPAAYGDDAGAQAALREVEEQVDRAAAELWGLTEEELREVKESLALIAG